MREIEASEFEARCLEIMNEVSDTGETIVVTKEGAPIAKLSPAQATAPPRRKPYDGSLKGSMTIVGDIVSPLDWCEEKSS